MNSESPTSRNKTDGSWIKSMPVMRWNVHLACNQTCAYCVSGSSPQNEFGVMADAQRMERIDRFFASSGPFNILFTGGEPLITPGIFDLFRKLIGYGHRITLQTNLKVNAEKFADAVGPENVGWITTTFHSVELSRFDRYLKNVLLLKQRGYPIAVKLVLDQILMPKFVPLYDALNQRRRWRDAFAAGGISQRRRGIQLSLQRRRMASDRATHVDAEFVALFRGRIEEQRARLQCRQQNVHDPPVAWRPDSRMRHGFPARTGPHGSGNDARRRAGHLRGQSLLLRHL